MFSGGDTMYGGPGGGTKIRVIVLTNKNCKLSWNREGSNYETFLRYKVPVLRYKVIIKRNKIATVRYKVTIMRKPQLYSRVQLQDKVASKFTFVIYKFSMRKTHL